MDNHHCFSQKHSGFTWPILEILLPPILLVVTQSFYIVSSLFTSSIHVVNSCGLIRPVDVILQLMIEKHFEQNGSRLVWDRKTENEWEILFVVVLLQHSSEFQSAGRFRQRRERGDVSAKWTSVQVSAFSLRNHTLRTSPCRLGAPDAPNLASDDDGCQGRSKEDGTEGPKLSQTSRTTFEPKQYCYFQHSKPVFYCRWIYICTNIYKDLALFRDAKVAKPFGYTVQPSISILKPLNGFSSAMLIRSVASYYVFLFLQCFI